MKKSKKQLILSIAACAMALSMAVGGTMAYMTDSETVTNTVTVGKVKIALSEPNYPGNESDQVKDLVPNEIVKKDPQVQNTGINDAIIYLKVEVPKADVTVAESSGTRGEKKVQEIFTLKNLKTGDDGTWMEIRKDDSATDKCVYIFAYKTKLAKDATTTPLFDEVQLKNVLEREIDATTQDIKINAYAIQADNILDVDTTTLDQTTLGKVYDIYVNQSGDKNEQASAENKDDQKSMTTVLLDGQTLNVRMKILAGNSTAKQWSDDTAITAIQHSDTAPSEDVKADANSLVSTEDSETPCYMWFEDGTIKWWSDSNKVIAGENLNYLCSYMQNLTDISGLEDWNTEKVTNIAALFAGCSNITDINPIAAWNTKNVTKLNNVFESCSALADFAPIASWNTESVTNINGIFLECDNLIDLGPISGWNVNNVTTMSSVFGGCHNLIDLNPIANWNTENVTNIQGIFSGCNKLVDLSPIASWNTENVTTMKCAFYSPENESLLTDLSPLSSWNVSNVTNMYSMFAGCIQLADLTPLASWDTSNVKTLSSMFQNCSSLTSLNGLENWNIGNVTDVCYAFENCIKLIDVSAINDWNIAKVTKFTQMFHNCPSYPEFTKRAGTWDNYGDGTFKPVS